MIHRLLLTLVVARRLRPNRPLGHCLNLCSPPSCDTLVLLCMDNLTIKRKYKESKETNTKEWFGWNSERPRKTSALCCLVIAGELPRGTRPPFDPHFVHRKTVQKVRRESESETHLGENPRLSANSTYLILTIIHLIHTSLHL